MDPTAESTVAQDVTTNDEHMPQPLRTMCLGSSFASTPPPLDFPAAVGSHEGWVLFVAGNQCGAKAGTTSTASAKGKGYNTETGSTKGDLYGTDYNMEEEWEEEDWQEDD